MTDTQRMTPYLCHVSGTIDTTTRWRRVPSLGWFRCGDLGELALVAAVTAAIDEQTMNKAVAIVAAATSTPKEDTV